MDTLGSIMNPILEYLQTGFDKVNAVQGLVIALAATVLMRKWGQLFFIAFAATIVNVALNTAIPIVAKGKEIKLPEVMTQAFWQETLSAFVGFVIVVAMFFAVKQVIFPASRKPAKPSRAH
jgi:hypothetical protein